MPWCSCYVSVLTHMISTQSTVMSGAWAVITWWNFSHVTATSDHRQDWFTCLSTFFQQFEQVDIKGNIKAPHHWPFVKGIHQWLVVSQHKWPVMQKVFPLHDIIMYSSQKIPHVEYGVAILNPMLWFIWSLSYCSTECIIMFYWFLVPQSQIVHWGNVSAYQLLTLKQQGYFFHNVIFFSLMLLTIIVTFLHEVSPIQWILRKHCGYWWSGALAPGHQ